MFKITNKKQTRQTTVHLLQLHNDDDPPEISDYPVTVELVETHYEDGSVGWYFGEEAGIEDLELEVMGFTEDSVIGCLKLFVQGHWESSNQIWFPGEGKACSRKPRQQKGE